jgi:hypothetical protein
LEYITSKLQANIIFTSLRLFMLNSDVIEKRRPVTAHNLPEHPSCHVQTEADVSDREEQQQSSIRKIVGEKDPVNGLTVRFSLDVHETRTHWQRLGVDSWH